MQGNSDLGWIAGNYTVNDLNFAFVAVPVPEPASVVLVLLGSGALWMARRRCRVA